MTLNYKIDYTKAFKTLKLTKNDPSHRLKLSFNDNISHECSFAHIEVRGLDAIQTS